jgi:HlyD family secretion protein
MYNENAATKRQVDEIDGKVNVIVEQIKVSGTQNTPMIGNAKAIDVQIEN